ncbi:MAG: hypothetical protein RR481_04590 [Longicatena sp.]
MMLKPNWWDYATFDSEGYVNGILKDAPLEIKKDFDGYLKQKEKDKKEGSKQ